MEKRVFYSWQSDLPNSTNRGFLLTALEEASKNIRSDDTIAVEPVVDRDTQNVSGSPEIASTIFSKISSSDVFVADISIVSSPQSNRQTPNPNVLIELGYAMKALGSERVVLVFNKAYGELEDLPFDLKSRRVIPYELEEGEANKSAKRAGLVAILETAIRLALKDAPTQATVTADAVKSAIEHGEQNRIIILRTFLRGLLKQIIDTQPTKPIEGGSAEDLQEAIRKTGVIIMNILFLIESAAVVEDDRVILEIWRWLGNILEKYDLPYGFSGDYHHGDFDYYRFIGHELTVGITALLMREGKWGILKKVLREKIPIAQMRSTGTKEKVLWDYASQHLYLLAEKSKTTQRISVHADMLKARYCESEPSTVLRLEDFTAADFFLYLATQLKPKKDEEYLWRSWYPRSIILQKSTPEFIKDASEKQFAELLLDFFSLKDIAELKERLLEVLKEIPRLTDHAAFFSHPLSESVIEKIGTSE